MSDPSETSPIPARAASASIFIATIVGIIALIAVLLSFDLFLARIDRRESHAHAAEEYGEGIRLLQQGHPSAAVERFSAASAIDRGSVHYALALANAMLEAGRTPDAEETLGGLLDRAGNDGAVNLTMAHVMVREGRDGDAVAYLHRAIFGRWGADSLERRRQARFELIDLLARRGDKTQLLAELLPFEEVSPDSTALRRRLGSLFLRAGSPARAANMFREVLRRDPDDADAYAGMGESALGLGNFRTARADFGEAQRLRPDDPALAARVALADTVLMLDPTARGAGLRPRSQRSRFLLARTIETLTPCGAASPLFTARVDSARSLVSRDTSSEREEPISEAMTAAAVELWASRPPACIAQKADEALSLVQSHLSQ